jgi:exodeoxyribonuclease VII large subunit
MEQLSLQELNELVKATLDTHLEPSYWVVAEIGELRVNQRGHCYMELVQKDEDQLIAKIRGNIWAYTYRNLSGWFEATTGQSLKPGLKILVNAMVQFHELQSTFGTTKNCSDQFSNCRRFW